MDEYHPKSQEPWLLRAFQTNLQIDLLNQCLEDAKSALDSFSITLFSIVIIPMSLRKDYPNLTNKGVDVAAFFSKRRYNGLNACSRPHVLLTFFYGAAPKAPRPAQSASRARGDPPLC